MNLIHKINSISKGKKLFCYILIISAIISLNSYISRTEQSKQQHPLKQEYKFDPNTYVDPYGTTTCYPSDISKSKPKGKYHYKVTISNASQELNTYEKEELINGELRLRKTSPDISYLNGTYIWDSDVYLPDEDAMFNYICTHYNEMKKYKVSGRSKNIYDEYNDRLYDYLEDPEDEIEYDPDIFDFLID